MGWWQEASVGAGALLAVWYAPGLTVKAADLVLKAGFYGGWRTVLFSGEVGKELAAASSGVPIFRTFIGGAKTIEP